MGKREKCFKKCEGCNFCICPNSTKGKDINADFSKVLKNFIDKSGKTAYRVAKEIEVSDTTLSYWLSGRRTPSIRHALMLSKCLNCSIYDLFCI